MEQQFSLSWNNFHGNLSKGFAGLLGNGEFVDVTIAVEGHLLQAHKVILSICSPYFKKMFQLNPCQHPIVVLRDVSHKAMKDLLQFMYHGEVSVKREDLTSFIGTAEVLQIKGLTNKQTDEENGEQERDLQKHGTETQNSTSDIDTSAPEPMNVPTAEETSPNNELDLLKQRQFIERLQRFSSLKRKSEEFLQKNYFTPDLFNYDKKQKKDKPANDKQNSNMVQNNYTSQYRQMYEDNVLDASTKYTHQKPEAVPNKTSKEDIMDSSNAEQTTPIDCTTEVKTECEDSDIVVTDPAICTTPTSFDGSREIQKDHLDYPTPQDNCSSLSSLFMDLKNLVNGKASHEHDIARGNVYEDYSRSMMDHRLVTIPQKEDGKKKYPQRSCRLCWKIGKRRDTRFMCAACELPFCKSPCFEIHFNNMVKASQLHGYYYAT
ncbi:hypothetical protein JYU34_004159 [Plutella xylostella]|uniref:BTB domain-containing protein n=1 Tax=Plutella xylostella TaxID=51655 RepID=A0ABQ7QX95_PLUXY|nr:hypothetical protein JYU34_004159 [Plutella xylostella]